MIMSEWIANLNSKIKKITIENENFYKAFYINWLLIKHNIFFWISTFLFIVSQPLLIIIFFVLFKNNIENYLFFISIIPLTFMIILNFSLINRIFSESKVNSIDLILISKPITKRFIFFSRYFFILIIIWTILFIDFLLSSLFVLSLNIKSEWVLFLLINNIFINVFLECLILPIFILMSTILKRIWFVICSMLVLSLTTILPIFTRIINNNPISYIEYNPNKYNSFSKVSILNKDKNSRIDDYLANEINSLLPTNNKHILNDLNSREIYNNFIPGEWFLSLNSSLANSLFFKENNFNETTNFSLTKNHYFNTKFENFVSNYENVLTIRPKDINFLHLSTEDYEKLLLEDINKINSDVNLLNLNDKLLIKSFLDKLQKNYKWDIQSMTTIELNSLKSFLGIDEEFNQLFYYLDNYHWLKQKTPNLFSKIKFNFNDELIELLNYFWTNNQVKTNLFNFKVFGNLNDLYPTIKFTDFNKPPTTNDINFIKDNLIKFNQDKIFYLDNNFIYNSTTIDVISQINSEIKDNNSWNEYVLSNTITLEKTKKLLEDLNKIFTNLYSMNLSFNSFNLYRYSYFLKSKTTPYLDNNWIYIILLIMLFIGMNYTSLYTFKNNNYKNMNA